MSKDNNKVDAAKLHWAITELRNTFVEGVTAEDLTERDRIIAEGGVMALDGMLEIYEALVESVKGEQDNENN